MPITDWPSQERPREKLLQRGADALSDAELLAIFLRTGVAGRSAVDLARDLLDDFGSLRVILEAGADVAHSRRFDAHCDQEPRQRQKPVLIRPAGLGRHRPARLRRHEGQVLLGASGRAGGQIEAEPQLVEQLQLPAHQQPGPDVAVADMGEHQRRRIVERPMRIALRQKARQGAKRAEPGQSQPVVEHQRGTGVEQLDGIGPQMLRETRPPARLDAVARL